MSTCTQHIFIHSSRKMYELEESSIHLVVTSPPYPMIQMWDTQFIEQDPSIQVALKKGKGNEAFERMHSLLDEVWKECYRVLIPGGFLCINIGDATRSLGGEFQLYSNHTRITEACRARGFTVLPLILWRKTTNSPTKFMGSGMYPAGAYVTLEHEYILIFRKQGKRTFHSEEEKKRRRESGFFWEERNRWFVDLWDLSGVRQVLEGRSKVENTRDRSAAYPLELALRLVWMYSLKGDWVLDPFLGTGTTLVASAIAGRNGVGYELDSALAQEAQAQLLNSVPLGKQILEERIKNHIKFLEQDVKKKKPYWNSSLQVPVVTSQETDINFEIVEKVFPIPSEHPSPFLEGAYGSFEVELSPYYRPSN